jgi:hypothetical protein
MGINFYSLGAAEEVTGSKRVVEAIVLTHGKTYRMDA